MARGGGWFGGGGGRCVQGGGGVRGTPDRKCKKNIETGIQRGNLHSAGQHGIRHTTHTSRSGSIMARSRPHPPVPPGGRGGGRDGGGDSVPTILRLRRPTKEHASQDRGRIPSPRTQPVWLRGHDHREGPARPPTPAPRARGTRATCGASATASVPSAGRGHDMRLTERSASPVGGGGGATHARRPVGAGLQWVPNTPRTAPADLVGGWPRGYVGTGQPLGTAEGTTSDVLERGGGGSEGGGGVGWDPPSSEGPPVAPAEGGPKFF